jgi:hypothetical protein
MKINIFIVPLVLVVLLASCQPATPVSFFATPLPPTSFGPSETRLAATVSVGMTSTAVAAQQSPFKAALTADALTAAVRTAVPTLATFDVSVPASACWIKSPVSVLEGQKVGISASGGVNTYGGKGSDNDPNGQESICGAVECPVQGVGYGALIGKLGEDGKPFFVGTKFELVATKDGLLYFTVNDWMCDDNSGAFDLQVTIR